MENINKLSGTKLINNIIYSSYLFLLKCKNFGFPILRIDGIVSVPFINFIPNMSIFYKDVICERIAFFDTGKIVNLKNRIELINSGFNS